MEEFADQIAYASYLVYVGLVDDKQQIEGMLSERRRVASTLDARLKAEQEYLAQAKTKEDKKASEERISALDKSRNAIDSATTDAEAEVKELDQTIRQAQADYSDALDAQLKRIRERPEPVAAK
jgi:dGTP triphosphohydrolase